MNCEFATSKSVCGYDDDIFLSFLGSDEEEVRLMCGPIGWKQQPIISGWKIRLPSRIQKVRQFATVGTTKKFRIESRLLSDCESDQINPALTQ